MTGDGPGTPRLQIVTGAPGTGKTAIIERLGPAIHRMPEPARAVIADYRLIEGPDAGQPPVEVFVDLLLMRSIEQHEAAQKLDGLVVFDRGVPDCIAYAEWLGTDRGPSVDAADRYRYRHEVLVMRPWEDIYTTDDERTMTFDMVVGSQEVVEGVYQRLGYALVEVPRGPIDERAAFVEAFVGSE